MTLAEEKLNETPWTDAIDLPADEDLTWVEFADGSRAAAIGDARIAYDPTNIVSLKMFEDWVTRHYPEQPHVALRTTVREIGELEILEDA